MHVSPFLLVSLVGALGLVVGVVGFVIARDRGRVGLDNPLLGAEARVSSVDNGGRTGTAYVNGELWRFESVDAVTAGDTLLVGSVLGLKIHLKRRT